MKRKNKTKEKGRSMIEMLGILAVIGVLSIGGLVGYSKAMEKNRANKMVNQIATIVTNIQEFYAKDGKYTGLSNNVAISIGAIPKEMIDASSTHTYGSGWGDLQRAEWADGGSSIRIHSGVSDNIAIFASGLQEQGFYDHNGTYQGSHPLYYQPDLCADNWSTSCYNSVQPGYYTYDKNGEIIYFGEDIGTVPEDYLPDYYNYYGNYYDYYGGY